MTDREKLIDLLSENFTEYCNVDIVAGHCKIRAITFDVDRFADFLISNGVTFQRWIPVTERLPEHEDAVLCFIKNGQQDILQFDKFENLWVGMQWTYKRHAVTHWMPLPEPPKEKG